MDGPLTVHQDYNVLTFSSQVLFIFTNSLTLFYVRIRGHNFRSGLSTLDRAEVRRTLAAYDPTGFERPRVSRESLKISHSRKTNLAG